MSTNINIIKFFTLKLKVSKIKYKKSCNMGVG